MPGQNSTNRERKNKKDLHGTKRSGMIGSKKDAGYISPDEEPAASKELRGTKTYPGKPSPTEEKDRETWFDDEDSVSQ